MTDEFNTLLEDDSAYQVRINILEKNCIYITLIYLFFFRYLKTLLKYIMNAFKEITQQ